jgi:hypothetical protein
MVASLERLHVNEEDDIASTLPMLGAPAMDVSGLQVAFGSCPTQMMNLYLANAWIDRNRIPRVSFTMLLPSLPEEYFTAYVANNGYELVFAMKVPSIWRNIVEMNSSMFKINGVPQYDRDHMRSVAMNQAVLQMENALLAGHRNYMIFEQRVRLPFKCRNEFTELEGRPGYKTKTFENGMLVAIIELIADDAPSPNIGTSKFDAFGPSHSTHAESDLVSCAHLTHAGRQGPTDGRSVVSFTPTHGNRPFRYQLTQGYASAIPEEVCTMSTQSMGNESVCSDFSNRTLENKKRSAPKRKEDKKQRSVRSLPAVEENPKTMGKMGFALLTDAAAKASNLFLPTSPATSDSNYSSQVDETPPSSPEDMESFKKNYI